MYKVVYKERYFTDINKLRCQDFEQVYIADNVVELGSLVYLYRGGFCQLSLGKSEIIKIEKL